MKKKTKRRGPGRPPEADPVATRRRIARAALDLFREEGYERTGMREIARRAGVSIGTLYHHFAAKDELVFDYYRSLQEAMHLEARNLFAKHRRLEDRLTLLLGAFVARMSLDRETLSQIARAAMEPGNPLSPFSAETEPVRAEAIAVQAELLSGSSITVPEDLRAHLPHLFWLLQMGVFLFWLHDSSEGQTRTRHLIRTAGALVPKLIRLASLPVMRGVRRELLAALEELDISSQLASGAPPSSSWLRRARGRSARLPP